jgi:ribosome maturation factor RimP
LSTGDLEDTIEEEIQPIVEGMGFFLVELKVGFSHNLVHVTVVVYRTDDMGIDDLTSLTRNLRPRLDLIDGLDNVSLTVASPGIDRIIKSRKEYSIFKGRGIKVLLLGESEWQGGTIDEADQEFITLAGRDGIEKIDLASIQKARLDNTGG